MELNGTITPKGGLTGYFEHDISDYNLLTNKPQINGETLIGDKSSSDLGLQDKITFPQDPTKYLDGEGHFTTPPTVGSYNYLTDKPQINNVTLTGNKTGDDLDLSNKAHFTELRGSVVSFQDGQELPLAKCVVDINPTQDLHGYSKPWAPGNGKNKIDVDNPDEPNKALDANGEWTNSNYYDGYTFPGGYIYTLSLVKESGFDTLRYAIRMGGSGARATSNMNNPLTIDATNADELRIVLGKTNFATNVMLEIGSAATSYEPYANICPITGESSVTVTVSDGGGNDTNYICALGRNVYGGNVNVINGDINITKANIATYAGEVLPGEWLSDRDEYEPGTTPTIGAQVVYELDTIQTDTTTPVKVKSRAGTNEISADTGDIDLIYINNVNDPAIEFILNNL